MALSQKKIQELMGGGADYVGDWLCWHEKQLTALPGVREKSEYIREHGEFKSCAVDMAHGEAEGIRMEVFADYIFEGMIQELRKRGYPR